MRSSKAFPANPADLYRSDSLAALRKDRDHALAGPSGEPNEPPSAQEIEAARKQGIWRDRELVHHDEVIRRILVAKGAIPPQAVANAFVVGLGKRAPALLSAISSYAVAWHLAPHQAEYPDKYFPCAVCGLDRQLSGSAETTIDWNSSLLARHETGGSSSLDYVLCDLEDFVRFPCPSAPDEQDIRILREVLEILRRQPPDSSPGKLAKALGSLAGKNSGQRTRLIEILGIIGILESGNHPSYITAFPRFVDRAGPSGKNDWEYPTIWWRGADGVNENAVQIWFSHLIA